MTLLAPNGQQRAAIDALQAQEHVLVRAGAGSGKTALLAQAIFEDVERHGIAPASIFAAAFNRSAAANLVGRLAARFAARATGDQDVDRAAGVRDPAKIAFDPTEAWIGTLHGLCARIVREDPFAAGVDPAFTELDDLEARALADQAIEAAIEQTDDPDFEELLSRVGGVDQVEDALRRVHGRLRAAGREAPAIVVPTCRPDALGAAEVALRAALDGLLGGDVTARQRAQAMTLIDALPSGRADAVPKLRRPGNAKNAAAVNAACDAHERLIQIVVDIDEARLLGGFSRALAAFTAGYAELKRELGRLDYDDLLFGARRVLESGAHELRFERVYVDEFQDVNALQAQVVALLAGRRTLRVGDISQAIYGFNFATPSHFRDEMTRTPPQPLDTNYRTHPDVLAPINAWVTAIVGRDPDNAFASLIPGANRAGRIAEHPVELVVVEGDRAAEARRVAVEVHRLRDELEVEWGEIAVLFRALGEVGVYEAALRDAGVPTLVLAATGYWDRDEVRDVLALLRIVENPLDEPALVRVLASPYVAASDEHLVRVAEIRDTRGARDGTGVGDPSLWGAVADRHPDLVELVARLRRVRREGGLAGLVATATGAAGIDLAHLLMADGESRLANLDKLVRAARAFARVRGDDLRAFLRFVERQVADQAREPDAPLASTTRGAVQLMSIHAAKGLEWPVVVLADTSHATPAGADLILVGASGDAGMTVPHVEKSRTPSTAYTALKDAEKAASAAEEARLVYVAMTRAVRHLLVTGRGGPRTGGGLMGIVRTPLGLGDGPEVLGEPTEDIDGMPVHTAERPVDGAADGPKVRVRWYPANAKSQTGEVAVRLERPALRPTKADDAPRPVPLAPPTLPPAHVGRRLSATSLAVLQTCTLRFHLRDSGVRDTTTSLGSTRGDAPSHRLRVWQAADLGDVVHRGLESVDWRATTHPPAPGWARSAAAELGLESVDADLALAERLVAHLWVPGSHLPARFAAAPATHAERAFAFALDGALLHGFVDLVAETPAGPELVDWKSGTQSTDHTLQQSVYALAATRAGTPPARLTWARLATSPPTTAPEPANDGPVPMLMTILASLSGPPVPLDDPPVRPACSTCAGLAGWCPAAAAGLSR